MNEIIYLEPESEITSVIDRIKNAESSSVALVIPRGGTLAQSIVNLKLLKKSADDLKKEISLVATDRISRNLASQIGLTVYSKVSEASRATPNKVVPEKVDDNDDIKVNNYYRNKEEDIEDEETEESLGSSLPEDDDDIETEEPEVIDNQEDESDGDVPAEEATGAREETEESETRPTEEKKITPVDYRKKHSNLKSTRKPILIFGSIGLILILIASFLFLPYATAGVELKTEDYETELSVVADRNQKDIDQSKLMIPSQLVELEKEESGEFDSTGKKDVGEKATGTLKFENQTLIAKTIKSGTTVRSDGGVSFVLTQDVQMPKGSLIVDNNGLPAGVKGEPISGTVQASVNGEQGNMGASTSYSVVGVSNVNVTGSTSGGVTKELKVVTESDLNKAAKSLSAKIAESAKTDLVKKAQEGGLSFLETEIKSEVITESATKKAGDEADKFSYNTKIKYFVLGFSNKDLNSLVHGAVADKIGSDKMVVGPENAEINFKITESDVNEGLLNITSTFNGKVGGKLEKKDVVEKIKNKSIESAKTSLVQNEKIARVELKVWPSFYKRTPILKNRFKVEFTYSK